MSSDKNVGGVVDEQDPALMEAMDFDDLSVIEVPVSIEGKKYILREADGDTACRYRNACLKCTKLGPDGKAQSVHGLADVDPFLVSLCLLQVVELADGKKNYKKVSLEFVRGRPNRVQKALFKRAKKIGKLDEIDDKEALLEQKKEIEEQLTRIDESKEEIAKNGSEGMKDGSD